jgi:uncharacterized protein (TIGR00251 family)
VNDKDRQDSRRLTIRVTPGASRNQITGQRDAVLLVKVAAPPVGGKANQALTDFLSRKLGVKRSAIKIVKGRTARNKIIDIEGMGREEAMKKLLAVSD